MFAFHSVAWWRRLWERTGIVSIDVAGTMPDGWRDWVDWQVTAHPDNVSEIEAVKGDRGQTLTHFRLVGRRISGVQLEDYCWPDTMKSFPQEYDFKPLLREQE
jgi:hypothetical protein